MATGAGMAGLLKLVVMLVGVFAIWRSNRARRRGETMPEDDDYARKRAERAETERRMASYLAQRSSAAQAADDDRTEQEIRR